MQNLLTTFNCVVANSCSLIIIIEREREREREREMMMTQLQRAKPIAYLCSTHSPHCISLSHFSLISLISLCTHSCLSLLFVCGPQPPPTCKAPPPGSISQSSAFSSSSSSSSATSNNNNNKFIMLMDHYIAHPPNIYNLANQDTADMLGDTVFTCFDVRSGGTKKDHYGVISHYKIWVDGRFGQYALCNGYNPGTCVGREDFKVGRESSLGTKEKGGQCANNTDTGSWFSFPEKGQCQSKQQLEDSTPTACTWYIEERVKTVNISCPFYTHGMLSACQNDQGKIPLYEKARSIFETAFLYNDEEKGGCQDLGGPPR